MNADAGEAALYSLDLTARITGMAEETILHYQERGFIRALPDPQGEHDLFDDEALHTLRRIDHLRSTCGVNDAGLGLILHLINELERLREMRS